MAAITSSVHPSLFRAIQRHCTLSFLLGVVYVYRVLDFGCLNFFGDIIGCLDLVIFASRSRRLHFLFLGLTVIAVMIIALMLLLLVSVLMTLGVATLFAVFLVVFMMVVIAFGAFVTLVVVVVGAFLVVFLLSVFAFFVTALMVVCLVVGALKFIKTRLKHLLKS